MKIRLDGKVLTERQYRDWYRQATTVDQRHGDGCDLRCNADHRTPRERLEDLKRLNHFHESLVGRAEFIAGPKRKAAKR